MVGGYPIPEVNRLMHAFMEGAKEINPKVKFTVSFIGSWFDPPKAKEAAFAMIDKGADVLYAERFGVSDAAKEKGKLAIGVDSDQYNTVTADLKDVIMTSMLKRVDVAVYTFLKDMGAGTPVPLPEASGGGRSDVARGRSMVKRRECAARFLDTR